MAAAEPDPNSLDVEDRPLDEREQKVWDAMHERLGELISRSPHATKSCLVRFIRGYATEKPDPQEAAIERLEACLKWREEKKVDGIHERKLPNEEKFRAAWPCGLHGFGKHGRAIYVERLGQIEPTVIKTFTEEEVLMMHLKIMEKVCRVKERIAARLGKLVYKHIVILDLKGFGWKHMGKDFTGPVKAMVNIDGHYFPEMLHRMVIVNAPFMFKAAWAMVSPWVHPLTKERIKFGKKYLADLMEPDQIPRFIDPLGKCKCQGECLFCPFYDGLPHPEVEEPQAATQASQVSGGAAPSPDAALEDSPETASETTASAAADETS